MNQLSKKVFFLKHSSLLFIPLLGTLIYKIQNYLIQKDIITIIRISRKNNSARSVLLNSMSRRAAYVICRSYKLRAVLKQITANIILDISIRNLSRLSLDKLYDLMWILVFSQAVTPKTKKSLNKFLYKSFPIARIIVIPFYGELNLVCDFIFQTAKELAKKGHVVYLLVQKHPKWFIKLLLEKIINRRGGQNQHGFNDFEICYPMTLFPLRLEKWKFFAKINKISSDLFSVLLIRNLNADILWTFDYQSLELVKLTKGKITSIYDCVDYYSSLNPTLDRYIKNRESELIKSVDFFFVNSHALEGDKSKVRRPNRVVPQGFDIQSFLPSQPLSRSKLLKIQRLFSKIPHPRVGFVGNLTYRLDFKLLSEVIVKMPWVSFVFSNSFLPFPGEDKYVKTKKLLHKLKSYPNTFFIPKTNNRRLIKVYIQNFDICIIPYNTSLDYNKYCYPMKLFEYFYVGKPVVSTQIKELRKFQKFVKVGNTALSWKKYIENLLSEKWPRSFKEEQRKLAENNSWGKKVSEILLTINHI